jgi:signal transduction histidine kinase
MADGLASTGDKTEAAGIYKKLLIELDLSDKERMHVLSRLVINLIKLNITAEIPGYYNQLQQLASDQKNFSDLDEYWLATAMYHDYSKQSLRAKSIYLRLVSQPNALSESSCEGLVQLADLYSRELKKDSADHYFNIAAKQLSLLPASYALNYVYEKLYTVHLQRFHKNELLVASLSKALSSQDSQYRQELVSVTRELSMKNHVLEGEKKVEQIKHQQQVDELNHDRMRQRAWLIIAALFLVAMVALAGAYIFYNRKKQASLLYKKELETIRQRHRTEVILSLSKAQESERGRIADQLHDEIGSMLSVARLNLSTLKKAHEVSNDQSAEKLETADKILGDVAQTVREMSHQLMPIALKKYGFKKAVEQLVEDIAVSGKMSVEQVIVGLDDWSKYPEDFQVGLYRIIQELLQNIIKHSGADKAFLQLIEHEDILSLLIEDNGQGMHFRKENHGKGLQLVSSRLDYLDGKLTVEKGSEGGTLLVIEIPIRHFIQA